MLKFWQRISWKTRNGKWDLHEIKVDLIILLIITLLVKLV